MTNDETAPTETGDTGGAQLPERKAGQASRLDAPRRAPKDEDEEEQAPSRRRAFVSREPRGRFRRRRKISYLTANKIHTVDYKDVALLRRFLSDQGKILSSRQTGATAKQQRMIARAIRRAREMALLPFVMLDASPGDRGPYRERRPPYARGTSRRPPPASPEPADEPTPAVVSAEAAEEKGGE